MNKSSNLIGVKTIKFEARAGAKRSDCIEEVLSLCQRYNIEAKLKHNGVTHTITPYTDALLLNKNWHN